jgi:mono/diheme cytochrome c family protein
MKRKWPKILGSLVLAAILLFAGVMVYVKTALPNVGPAPELKIENTTTQIERGRYLANHVAVCIDCHSSRDWTKFSGPPMVGTFGKGGEKFDQTLGFPGAFYSKNITPAGLGNWTDGEIFRAITAGVSKDGSALFPVMPHHLYGQLDQEDIKAIIAYLRTLAPIENPVAASTPDFPMNFIINTIPAAPKFQTIPVKTDEVAYGKYMITASGCVECHTQKDKGQNIPGMEYAGGMEFKFPNGSILRSTNITPDPKTGIGNWTREAFINRFKMHANGPQPVADGGFQTLMPWSMYAGMTEEDLGAIYAYLQTVPAKENKIQRFTAAIGQ